MSFTLCNATVLPFPVPYSSCISDLVLFADTLYSPLTFASHNSLPPSYCATIVNMAMTAGQLDRSASMSRQSVVEWTDLDVLPRMDAGFHIDVARRMVWEIDLRPGFSPLFLLYGGTYSHMWLWQWYSFSIYPLNIRSSSYDI